MWLSCESWNCRCPRRRGSAVSDGTSTQPVHCVTDVPAPCAHPLPLSTDLPVHLTAGCTNGKVLDFHWESLTADTAGEIPEPLLTPLWPCADSIPVHHIVWQTKVCTVSGRPRLPLTTPPLIPLQVPSQEQCWVVINKGSSLVALSSPETAVDVPPPRSLPPHLLVCGIHSMPVSGQHTSMNLSKD